MRFTNDPPRAGEIRSLAEARYVLLLRLDKTNEHFRVTAALRRGERERAIWSASYRGAKSNLVVIGTTIVTNLAFAMHLKEGPSLVEGARRRLTANFQALELYGRAWEPWRSGGTRESFQIAIHAANDAIHLATNYADAYLRLGNIYRHLAAFDRDPKETMELQERIVTDVLRIDNTHPDAYTMLGGIKVIFDWDFREAERLIRRAVELEPARWNGNLSFFLRCMGRLSEARLEAARGLQMNPKGLYNQTGWISQMRLERRFPEALAAAETFRAQQPNGSFSYLHLGLIYYDMEDYPKAVAVVKQGIEIQVDAELLGLLGAIYADMGKTNEARAVIRDIERIAANAYANPYFFAGIYAALGEKEQAFRYLDKAVEARSENLVNAEFSGLHNDKRLDKLRDDPRFAELVRRVGLPPWPQRR